MADVLWFNGRFTTTDERLIGVEDRGFQFGDSIYEVFKFLRRRPLLLPDHFHRLERSLHAIEIANPWTEESFVAMVDALLERTKFDAGIVYVQVSRGESERAHFWRENVAPTALAYSRAFRFPDEAKKDRGIRVITTREIRWSFCNVKSTNLLGNALAKKEAQRAGAEEAIFIADGLVHEGASTSFFAVKGRQLITHPLDEHILPGVVRDRVIGLALAAKIRVDERALREAELIELDEAFITSTTQGVMPVTEIDGRMIGNSRRGEVTAELQQLFDHLEESEVR
jgi:D-alanine transaminase